MASTHYIPRADPAFDQWQANYVLYALDNSPALGLSHAEVVALETAQISWQKNYNAIAEARATLGSAVAAKDSARAGFESLIRKISGRLQHDGALTDAERAALGLTIPDTTRTPVAVPDSAPALAVDAGTRLLHRVRFADSATPLRKAKPRGTIGLDLRLALTAPGAPAPASPGDYEFHSLATRSPASVDFAGADVGMTAHYVSRWINPRGEPGPWSATASATVGG